jgi:hypothetical protein
VSVARGTVHIAQEPERVTARLTPLQMSRDASVGITAGVREKVAQFIKWRVARQKAHDNHLIG